MTQVLGVIVLARNGDRLEYYQDPTNYETSFTETTALGEVSLSLNRVLSLFSLNITLLCSSCAGPISRSRLTAAVSVPKPALVLVY
jgi:hypothetical protein